MTMTEKEAKQLYVHVPFCKRKCNYCDFCSSAATEADIDEYVALLEKEISLVDYDGRISTCYIGGGTPTLLGAKRLEKTVRAAERKFRFLPEEFSVEANPESLTESFLAAAKDLGVNRLSIGVQSLDDEVLKTMGRLHDVKQAERALTLAGKYFDNVNADLILGFSAMSESEVADTVKRLADLNVKHVSAYGLQVEQGTVLAKMIQNGLKLPDDDCISDIYDCFCDSLAQNGYLRYEISNFAKPGFECKHNLGYWRRNDYIGVGLSAHGFVNSVRSFNTSDMAVYRERLGSGRLPVAGSEKLTAEDEEFETIMLALRTVEGLDVENFEYKYKCNFKDKYKIPLKTTRAFTEFCGKRFRLTDDGFYVSNSIIAEFMI